MASLELLPRSPRPKSANGNRLIPKKIKSGRSQILVELDCLRRSVDGACRIAALDICALFHQHIAKFKHNSKLSNNS